MQLSTPERQRVDRLGWIIDQLSLAAVAKGQVFPPERLRINAEDLIDIPQDALAAAFGKARRELDYLPGVAEIRRLALADEASRADAEMRSAWDLTIQFVDKYVSNNIHGEFGPEFGWYGPQYDRNGKVTRPASFPPLDQRILDVVRRTGGWKQYKCMTENDLPFQQKRFFDEYNAWVAVEKNVDLSKLIAVPAPKQLPTVTLEDRARPARAAETQSGEVSEKPHVASPVSKSRAGEESSAERRSKLKKQANELLAKRTN